MTVPRLVSTRMIPFAAGALFGLGLIVSRMTDPSRVTAFLDVAGDWNPALAFVMGGAVAVTIPAFAWVRRGGGTLVGVLTLPNRTAITWRLVGGSAMFGIGWGLSGVCPGPGVVIAASGTWQAMLFLASMVIGIAAYFLWSQRGSRNAPDAAVSAQVPPQSSMSVPGSRST